MPVHSQILLFSVIIHLRNCRLIAKGVYLGFGFSSNPGISKTVRGTNQKLGKQVGSECAIYTKEGRLVLCICAHIEAPHGGNMGPALLEQ